MARVVLPVADTAAVRRYARRLMARHPGQLTAVIGLHGLAALAGLVTPYLLGRLVDGIQRGTGVGTVDRIALGLVTFVVVQAVLVRFAAFGSANLGERVLAELREEFVDRVLAI